MKKTDLRMRQYVKKHIDSNEIASTVSFSIQFVQYLLNFCIVFKRIKEILAGLVSSKVQKTEKLDAIVNAFKINIISSEMKGARCYCRGLIHVQ